MNSSINNLKQGSGVGQRQAVSMSSEPLPPKPTRLTLDDLIEGRDDVRLIRSDQNVIEVDFESLIRSLRLSGQILRSDLKQTSLLEKPEWFSSELFHNGQSIYGRHFMGVNFAHLSGLLLLVRVNSIYNTLSLTGESSKVAKLFRRYYNTIKHVKCWYEGNIFEEHAEAYRSLLMVRGMHNKVSSKLNDKCPRIDNQNYQAEAQPEENDKSIKNSMNSESKSVANGIHISEYDLMLTQFAFVGFIVIYPEKMGLMADFDQRDMDSFLHFWRIIGYYLGLSDKYNLCSYDYETIKSLCQAIMKVEYKESLTKNKLVESPQGIMSINIVRSLKFLPMLTAYGMMRYLYEILDYTTSELDSRQTWYSRLSYNLIKLVLSQFLAYKPLRLFNNGLTRLSLFLIGKLEDWFSNHLDSRYGHELKA